VMTYGIEITGIDRIDIATAEIAVALRDGSPGKRDQHYYGEAQRLRDEIMQGTASLAADVLGALFSAADDDEAAAIESAAVRVGLFLKCRECGCGIGATGDLCQACGADLTGSAAAAAGEAG